ncbi:MAG: ABC transporter ATP-binding protein/permease [Methylacidiphilales bacterium]|nr:ABC transporter ATP-binding protein/permease [Candidatus Methylacidiphilales bacterium]
MKTFRRVWVYARAYPLLAVATFGAAVLGNLAGLIFPKATGMVIDNVLSPHRPDLLLPYVLVVIGSFFLRDALNAVRVRSNNTFEQKVVFDLRRDLYSTLQRLPLRWYDQRATGDILTRVIDDVTNMERVLIDGVEQGIVALLQIIGVGIVMYWSNPRLTAWMLLPMPLLVAGAVWYTMTARFRYRDQRRAASAMNSLLLDNLQGVRQIKSYAREETELERFSIAARLVGETQLVIMRTWSWYSSSMTFFGALGSVIVLYVGGTDVLHGTMQFGDFVTFLLYVGMFYDPIGRLHQINQLYQSGRAAYERVTEILDAAVENYGKSDGEPIARAQGRVEYRHVSFAYRPDVPALHGIELAVESGQCVALVGPTGAGKSTLVSLLSRFYEATHGEILLDGRNIAGIPLSELRDQIGVVSQETFLFNGTILDNLRFGRPGATRAEIEQMARAACVHDFVSELPEGYDTHVGERGVKLSVGEKQRISIARALLKDPPVLVLDEATASVDTATEQFIQQALRRLLSGRTSFVIAHRLSTVRHADLILVLQKGRIVERGTHDDLLARNGLYAKLCRAQHTDRFFESDIEAVFADDGKDRSWDSLQR